MKEYSILIIEDDEDIREGIRILFSGENYRITEAGSGEEGLRLFSGDIDLVILDIMMPHLDGLSVLKKLRAAGKTTPVLLLTARDAIADRVAHPLYKKIVKRTS